MPAFLFLLLVAGSAQAQARWGARIGVADGETMLGADMLIRLRSGFFFNPGVEVSSAAISANADLHYDIELTQQSWFWLGTGIAAVIPENEDVDLGVNLIAGIGVQQGRRIIYTQFKNTKPTSYDSYSTIALGVRF